MRDLLTFIFVLCYIGSFSQEITCKLETDKRYSNDSIRVSVSNQGILPEFVSIGMQKLINMNWVLYSSDILTKPFSGLSCQTEIKPHETRKISFIQREPELIDYPDRSKKYNDHMRKDIRYGNFRLIIYYGIDYTNLVDTVYSDEFTILPPAH